MTAQPIEARSLHDAIRDAVREHPDIVDPATLAQKLMTELPDDVREEATWRGLLDTIRSVTSLSHARRLAAVPQHQGWRVRKAQEAAARRLSARLSTEDGVKELDDCTADDLAYAAAVRRRLAEGNLAAEAALLRLAGELSRAKATHVRDLPAEVVRAVLAGTDLADGA